MRIPQFKFASHIQQQLAHFYIVTGDEPLLVSETCQAIRDKAIDEGFSERELLHVEAGFDWPSLLGSVNTLSLFSTKSLVELRLSQNKFSDAAKSVLQQFADNCPTDKIIMLICDKLDNSVLNTKWFKAIEQNAVVVQVWPLNLAQMPQWTRQRLARYGLQAHQEVIQLLVDRAQGNLLALMQEIEKLSLLYPKAQLDYAQVQQAIADSARFNVFELADCMLAGDVKQTLRIIKGLHAEGVEPILVLWSIARELRALAMIRHGIEQGESESALFTKQGVWPKRRPLYSTALKRHKQQALWYLLTMASKIDQAMKTTSIGNIWDDLSQLAVAIAGGLATSIRSGAFSD